MAAARALPPLLPSLAAADLSVGFFVVRLATALVALAGRLRRPLGNYLPFLTAFFGVFLGAGSGATTILRGMGLAFGILGMGFPQYA
jgi:hypothetical protein